MTTGGNIDPQQYTRVSDIVKEPQKMLMPIRGYEEMPIVSLEEAVTPLISILPEIQDYAYVAKERCESVPPDDLTQDESASIMLYSMEWEPHDKCLYFVLNAALRTEDRRKLKPWFLYLKLILTALEKLPFTRRHVFRGVNLDLSDQYTKGKKFVWWGFSSCTTSLEVLENEQFLGKTGERTMFTIECDSGKDISRHSYFQSEKEVLLLAARQFIVISYLRPAPGLHMIQLKETKPPITLLQPVTNQSIQSKPSANFYQSSQSTISTATISENPITTSQISTQFEINQITLSGDQIRTIRTENKLITITNSDILKRHKEFIAAHPTGEMDKEAFLAEFQQLFPRLEGNYDLCVAFLPIEVNNTYKFREEASSSNQKPNISDSKDETCFHGGNLLTIEQQQKLNEFLGENEAQWDLVYKAKRDGFRGVDFHRQCDEKGPTMTIIKSKAGGYLFGGYTAPVWSSDNGRRTDSTAFLFTITNPHGTKMTKFNIGQHKSG
ncbi:unnamed protein product [Adineta steineri]|nr:unnamed protein product [Adineta steineri]